MHRELSTPRERGTPRERFTPHAMDALLAQAELVTVGALQRMLQDFSDLQRAELQLHRQILMDVLHDVRSMRPPSGQGVAQFGCGAHPDASSALSHSHTSVRPDGCGVASRLGPGMRPDSASVPSHTGAIMHPDASRAMSHSQSSVCPDGCGVASRLGPGMHPDCASVPSHIGAIMPSDCASDFSHPHSVEPFEQKHSCDTHSRQVDLAGTESRFFMARALGFLSPEGVDMRETFQRRPSDGAFQAFTRVFPGSPNISHGQHTSLQRALAGKLGPDLVRRGAAFDRVSACFISVNAICIGIHAHRRALRPWECDLYWEGIVLSFNILFVLELALRALLQRKAFLTGVDRRWNWLDLMTVLCGVIEDILKLGTGKDLCSMNTEEGSVVFHGVTSLRVVRTLRLLRILKVVRIVPVFRELRIMVDSTLHCLAPLAWACLLLALIHWCFTVYFLHLVADFCGAAILEQGVGVLTDDTKPYKRAREYFGSHWSAMFTLFESITGGINWNEVTDALYEASGSYIPVVIYAAFVSLTTFAVLNVITGIFVENATKNTMKDRDLIVQDRLTRRDQFKEDALRVFHEANADGSGELTVDEFMTHLEDPTVQAFLENLELDVTGAQRLFRLIDLNEDGKVSAQEFVTGCVCLKGAARTMDVAALLREVHQFSRSMRQSIAAVHGRLDAFITEASKGHGRIETVKTRIGEKGHDVNGV